MSPLAQLQAQMQRVVREGGAAPAGLLRGNTRGLAAYQHAYPARLLEALADNYGATAQALGDEGFEALGLAYARAHPPTEPSIRWFGDRLAEFMDGWDALPHPALADLARLDWALRGAFDAAQAPVFGPAELAALPPEAWMSQALQLQAHVRRVRLDWAVGPSWHALAAARESGEETELPEPAALHHELLVWREGLQTRWRSLEADEAGALASVASDRPTLTQLLEQAGESALPRAVGWLQRWTADGLLVRP